MDEDTNYLKSIINGLVDTPEGVHVIRTTDERGVLFTVHAEKDDMGRIIGRGGELAKALRLVMRAYGAKRKISASIVISDPQ